MIGQNDWQQKKSSFEGSGSLQIEQAILFAGNAGESDSLYDLTVTLHNVGDTLEKYLPQLYVMESEQPDNSKVYLSLQPISLYEEINAAGVNNYDIDLCIPPGQMVTVSYSVTVSDYQEIQALRDDGKTVSVSLSNRKAKQNVCVPLQFMEIETGEKGGI